MKVEVPEYEVQEELTTRPGESVLLVVDMQNDFMHPDGALAAPDPDPTVDAVTGLIEGARSAEVPVWYTQDTHREDDPEWDIWGRHVEEDTWGWEFIDGIEPRDGELVFRKARYDGFYGTQLDHELRTQGITQLVICGTVANICVHYTAASAALRWYDVVHPVEAIQALTEFDRHAALRQASWLFGADLVHADGLAFG
ncbi:MAG: isochorismatase family cysteine hydrolase [Candidatus Palauibacterales bacterium]|nr:isochorismatase family cysteine hydrolase [Candidatus Palauibacterales bacterium]